MCSKCRFWQREGADGICRFFPPRPRIMEERTGRYVVVWPRSNPDDWCGKWEERSAIDES